MPTRTSNFGAGRRESHDASGFYGRFTAPAVSRDDHVTGPITLPEPCILGDARDMRELPDASVALVVTSPPYFAGKEYEEALGVGHIPGSYLEYLTLLRDVFAECVRVLEPGGRIAVNIANLGRKPYRSLSADVVGILQDDLGLLLRGEIVWRKGEGASGSCAWGSFRSPANPVLRDVTERIVVAAKGRFDRAVPARERAARGLPHAATITTDEFMDATLDVWDLPPEQARRVGHPAPFPVELPQRLIELYTYRGDLVLDPFMGSGSTLVAARRTGREAVGYDMDNSYVEIARQRLRDEGRERDHDPQPVAGVGDQAAALLEEAGFVVEKRARRLARIGVTVDLVAADADGAPWHFDVTGGFTVGRSGLARAETLWRSLGRVQLLVRHGIVPVVLLTSQLPRRRTEGDVALRAASHRVVFDAIEIGAPGAGERLAKYAAGGHTETPLPGFWTDAELAL